MMSIKVAPKLLVLVLLVTTSCVCILYYTKFTGTVTKWSLKRNHTGSLQYRPATSTLYQLTQKQEAGLWAPDELIEGAALKESIVKDMQRCSLAMGISPDALSKAEIKIATIADKAAFFLKTFWEIVPKKFLSEFKNPCWYSNVTISKNLSNYFLKTLPCYMVYKNQVPESDLPWLYRELYEQPHTNTTLHCLPYFLIPGIPKSGTTTLHSVLSQHPQIMAPERKEPQWWYELPLTSSKRYLEIFIGRYLTSFVNASSQIGTRKDGPSLITYDASQTMMTNIYDTSFHIDHEDYCALPAVISRVLPNAKIIVMLREPIARLYSQYHYNHGPKKAWPKEMAINDSLYFDRYIIESILNFKLCLNNNSVYECVNQVRTNYDKLQIRIGSSVYYIFLQKWLQFWPRENFLFVTTEEMSSNPSAALKNVTDFLSLLPFSEKEAVRLINDRQNVQQKYSKMNPLTELLLKLLFEPYNKKLEGLSGVKF